MNQDVTELAPADVAPHHILTAGFPCQSFSQLGARHGGRESGADGRLGALPCPLTQAKHARLPAETAECRSFVVVSTGLEDETRGNLIWHVLRIARATRPAALLLENVRGLLTIDGGETLATILSGIKAIGYCVDYTLVNSATVLAQHRCDASEKRISAGRDKRRATAQ
jgi:site-specific DNA-cytosine methylase